MVTFVLAVVYVHTHTDTFTAHFVGLPHYTHTPHTFVTFTVTHVYVVALHRTRCAFYARFTAARCVYVLFWTFGHTFGTFACLPLYTLIALV